MNHSTVKPGMQVMARPIDHFEVGKSRKPYVMVGRSAIIPVSGLSKIAGKVPVSEMKVSR
jgi:hypothetical protein